MDKKYIVNFSGGKDSTAMLFKLLELGKPIDSIIFADTGVEFPELYKHLEEVQKRIYPLKITKVKGNINFFERLKDTGFPHIKNRWCTGELKIKPIRDYIRKEYGLHKYFIVDYIGFALDEKDRAEKRMEKSNKYKSSEFPLIDLNMTEKDALAYCKSLGFNWSGLYKKMDRVSCWICP